MTKRIGIVFPGYGEQFIGMGKDLYDESRVVQEYFEQAASVAETNFVKLLFASSDKDISSVRYAYLAIFLFESSLYEVLWQHGLRPDFLAGYGIGEYAACFASRSLSLVDGLYFINKYSLFYDEFLKDKDYSVLKITRDFSVEAMQELIDEVSTEHVRAHIAAQNTKDGYYISGSLAALEKIQEYCKKNVIRKVKALSAGYGLHSDAMDTIVEQLKLYYHKISFKELQVPVITNVDGVYVTSADALQSSVVRRINNKIDWYQVSKGFEGCDIILSVGPGTQLIEWFEQLYPDKEYYTVQSLADINNLKELIKQLNGTEIDSPKSLSDADRVNEKSSDYDSEE